MCVTFKYSIAHVCLLKSRTAMPDPLLADNQMTVAFLKERAGGNAKKIADIEAWGEARQRRVDALNRFTGLLESNGVYEQPGGRMSRITMEFATNVCFAIATKHGLDDMGYTFNDSESGPISANLYLDLQAVNPTRVESPTGLFASPENEEKFLQDIAGKDVYELGRLARTLVIEERYRIYDRPRRVRR